MMFLRYAVDVNFLLHDPNYNRFDLLSAQPLWFNPCFEMMDESPGSYS